MPIQFSSDTQTLATVCAANPADESARLVFADALQDEGLDDVAALLRESAGFEIVTLAHAICADIGQPLTPLAFVFITRYYLPIRAKAKERERGGRPCFACAIARKTNDTDCPFCHGTNKIY